MISAKQLKNVLEYSFSGGSLNFIAPGVSFVATPSTYTDTSIPGSVSLNGTIIPNDGLNISWTVTDPSNGNISSGIGNTISIPVSSVPSTIGSFAYSLTVTYEDSTGASFPVTTLATISVTAAAKVGQLANSGDDFTTDTEFNNLAVESSFIAKTQSDVINLFSFQATGVGRVVIIAPDSFGSVVDIQDNTDSSVLSQFDAVTDIPNNRTLYVSKNALTPATYHYKIVY